MNTTKSRFLLTTAVFLAGVSLAAAQGLREGAGGGGETHHSFEDVGLQGDANA